MTAPATAPQLTAEHRSGLEDNLFARYGVLLRLVLRRERVIAPATVLVFAAVNAATAASIGSSYPTMAQRMQLAQGPGANVSFRFLLGPLEHIDSTAAVTVWRAGLFMIAALGVCVAMMVVRHTRKEEELGRLELVRAGATGTLAPLAAAVSAAVLVAAVIAAVMSVMLLPLGADAGDAAAVFAQYFGVAVAAIAVAAVAAQVATTAQIATVVAVSVVLVGYVLRGVADSVDGWGALAYTSPLGWAERIDPFGANALAWGLLCAAAGAAVLVGAAVVAASRDLGAGVIDPRPGPASTSRLSSPGALAARLMRPLLLSWVCGVAIYALVVGVMQPSIGELADGNEQVMRVIGQSGLDGGLGVLFGLTMLGLLAVAASAWGVNVVTRLRAEESAERTETVLATPTSRTRFFLTYVAVGVVGVLAILAGAAAGMIVGNGLAGGGWAQGLADTSAAAAVQIPAVLVIVALAFALYGTAARAVVAGWIVVVAALFLGPLAGMFEVPQWLRNLSPFTHTPQVPLEPVNWVAVTSMLAVAVVFALIGLARFRRRDVG